MKGFYFLVLKANDFEEADFFPVGSALVTVTVHV